MKVVSLHRVTQFFHLKVIQMDYWSCSWLDHFFFLNTHLEIYVYIFSFVFLIYCYCFNRNNHLLT